MVTFWHIAFYYLKYIFIILTALVVFMVGFDYLGNKEKLDSSANLVLLYIFYKTLFAVDMMLPLSLIFAMIATKIYLIRSNALVALYSLGYTKLDVLKPFVVVSTSIVLIYIALHATPFAKADEYSNNLRSNLSYMSSTKKLFFTFEDKYIYFGELHPLQDRAEDIRIFLIEGESLRQIVVAEEAYYRDGSWQIEQAHVLEKPQFLTLGESGLSATQQSNLLLLEGFKPTILDQVYEGKVNYTIVDAIDALVLLKSQNINVYKIKSALYRIFATPFFVPSLIVIIFFMVPLSTRSMNITLFTFGAILATILTWSVLFILTELSNNKTIASELGILLPAILLVGAALHRWYKERGLRRES